MDTRAIKENEGPRAPPGAPVLPDLQLRCFDSGTAPLCSRGPDYRDPLDQRARTGPQDPQERMENPCV